MNIEKAPGVYSVIQGSDEIVRINEEVNINMPPEMNLHKLPEFELTLSQLQDMEKLFTPSATPKQEHHDVIITENDRSELVVQNLYEDEQPEPESNETQLFELDTPMSKESNSVDDEKAILTNSPPEPPASTFVEPLMFTNDSQIVVTRSGRISKQKFNLHPLPGFVQEPLRSRKKKSQLQSKEQELRNASWVEQYLTVVNHQSDSSSDNDSESANYDSSDSCNASETEIDLYKLQSTTGMPINKRRGRQTKATTNIPYISLPDIPEIPIVSETTPELFTTITTTTTNHNNASINLNNNNNNLKKNRRRQITKETLSGNDGIHNTRSKKRRRTRKTDTDLPKTSPKRSRRPRKRKVDDIDGNHTLPKRKKRNITKTTESNETTDFNPLAEKQNWPFVENFLKNIYMDQNKAGEFYDVFKQHGVEFPVLRFLDGADSSWSNIPACHLRYIRAESVKIPYNLPEFWHKVDAKKLAAAKH